jgi:predicted nuclease of restriction endonuclease-like (RecB) superfamily
MIDKINDMALKELTITNDTEYQQWLRHLYDEIDRQRLKAMIQLNAATLQHYWWLGNDIVHKQKEQGWGAKVINQLSIDLQKHYGNDSGYSIRNLKYMKQFAEEYPDFPFVQVPLAQIQKSPILQARLANFTVTADGEFVQVPLAQITWYHHISMISKVKDMAMRAFYITEASIQGWSRDIMMMQIEDEYYKKAVALPNNFDTTLPPVNSDLAKSVFKDPYNFGFVDMTKVKQEKDLEDQLACKVTDFLLELGKGFSYIGKQYPLNIAGEENKVDLLMYHTRLHCYVAIELKVGDFKPEFLSKLNYYISAIDDLVKMPEDNPTIGLLLCRSKNNTKVEYALRGMTQPLGVAEYQTNKLMENLKSELPSIDDLENTIK